METLQDDLSLEEQGRLARSVQIEFVRYLAQSEPTVAVAEDGLEMWRTPLDWAFCNGAYLGRNPTGRNPTGAGDPAVDAIFHFFARNPLPSYMIWLDEKIDHAAWGTVLTARGFLYDPGSPCLTLDTRTLPATPPVHPALRIEHVGDLAGLEYFAQTNAAGFERDEQMTNGLIELWAGFGVEGPHDCYIGYVDDVAVTSAASKRALGAVGIEFVSTLPAYRGKGYGGAITQHIAYESRARGFRYVTLSSSDQGKPVYERLGFVPSGFADNYYPPRANE